MLYRVVYSAKASRQIRELGEYIASRNSRAVARAYVERLQAHCEQIGSAPFQGTRRDEMAPGTRTTGFERRITIAFRVQGETVLIAAIAYGGRRIEAAL